MRDDPAGAMSRVLVVRPSCGGAEVQLPQQYRSSVLLWTGSCSLYYHLNNQQQSPYTRSTVRSHEYSIIHSIHLSARLAPSAQGSIKVERR
eukprot:4142292-Prymnesium_polylepis.1